MNKSIIYFVLSLVLFSSCTEKVDIELNETQVKTVIEGYISTEVDSSYIRLSRTAAYFGDQRPPEINDATVTVNEGGVITAFTYDSDGYYRPAPGFKGTAGKTYDLKVNSSGEEFTSIATLYPMFEVDTNLQAVYKDAEGFLPSGYAVIYLSKDSRPELIYTQFNFGKNDTFEDVRILFSNAGIVKNQFVPFELPFFRPQSGDSVMLVFKSLGKPQADYFTALDQLNAGIPGPFSAPPANPPTNIKGGALGYFLASDVLRLWKKLP